MSSHFFVLYIRCRRLLCFCACSIANLLCSLAFSYSCSINAVSLAFTAGLSGNLGSLYVMLEDKLGIIIFGALSKFPELFEHAIRNTLRFTTSSNFKIDFKLITFNSFLFKLKVCLAYLFLLKFR